MTGTFGAGSKKEQPTVPHLRVIGPGRAGTSLAGALRHHGWDLHPFIARGDDLVDAARDTDVLAIATPDGSIADVAAAVAPVESTLVIHLAGSLPADVLAPHPRRGALHPLMTLPDAETGTQRLIDGVAWAVDGPRDADERWDADALAAVLSDRVYRIAPADRTRYHAAAAIASNHLVALAGQVDAVAAELGVPIDAYLDLMAASIENVRSLGVRDGLTGPAARGDVDTIERHLAELPDVERQAYLALAERAARIAGRELDLVATR